jgi:hypothetical protein
MNREITVGEYFKLLVDCFGAGKQFKDGYIKLIEENNSCVILPEEMLNSKNKTTIEQCLSGWESYPKHKKQFIKWYRKKKLSQCCFN